MSQSIIEYMKGWLDGDVMREIEVKGHCHGIRITLCDQDGEVCSCVGTTFNDALTKAFELEPTLRPQRLRQKVEREEHSIERDDLRLKERKRNLSRMKSRLCAT